MLEIRQYQASDREAVWNLHVLALQLTGAYLGNGPWDDDLHRIEEHYLRNRGEFLVGYRDSRLVGMGAFRKVSETEAEIKRMRVHPDWQGQGIGRVILEQLEDRAKALGYTRLRLETSEMQVAAQKLYLRSGFRERERAVIHGLNCIWFEKEIA